MADPEGNVFFLIPHDPLTVDDQGRTNYRDAAGL